MRVISRRHSLPLAAGVLLAVSVFAGAAGAVQHGPWQAAQLVDPADGAVPANDTTVNSTAGEGCPIESPDGKSLYIMSTRGPGSDQDIWRATRDDVDEPFGDATELPGPVNSGAQDFCPTPLRGGGLLFVSTRGGTDAYGTPSCGGGDMYVTRMSPATGEWAAPRNLGCAPNGPNSTGIEYGPSLAGGRLYFSSGSGAPGGNTQDIMVSRRVAGGGFGAAEPVASLNTGSDDMMPNVRKDGLEMVFATNRAGSFDIYAATRNSVAEEWGSVTPVTAVNTSSDETRPSLSWHADRLYFGRGGDIWVSTR